MFVPFVGAWIALQEQPAQSTRLARRCARHARDFALPAKPDAFRHRGLVLSATCAGVEPRRQGAGKRRLLQHTAADQTRIWRDLLGLTALLCIMTFEVHEMLSRFHRPA